MPRSQAYRRIKHDVCRIVASIPAGRVTTYASIGAYMSVVPRHVAYILATLGESEQLALPWQRVVGVDGALGAEKHDAAGRSRTALLTADAVGVRNGRVADFQSIFIDAAELDSGVEPHQYYLDETGR